ncbi:MAG: hypothetical protein LBV23_00965, partial [Deltaproteobacteria bacterium]|nr:hypothetical protein [Deltaproteobacteria bacterium]
MSDDNSIRGRVGVVRDENGSLGDPLVSSVIDLYKKKDGSWCLESSLNWPLCQTKQASDLRNRLIALATYLDGLKVLVGKSFGGLAFRILQSQGVDLCRMDDFGVDCLDELMEVLDNGEKDDITPLYPVEIG